jgi:hypothetical protein
MMNTRTLGALAAGALVLSSSLAAQKPPALTELLKLGADYQASYASRVSGALLDEHYTLIQLHAGRMGVPVRFASDVLLVNVSGRLIAMRDPYTVDNVALRERTPRIAQLLTEPTLAAWQRAQEFQHESNFRFVSDLILHLNDPTLALQFIAANAQAGMTYKLENVKRVDGTQIASIGFKENGGRDTKFKLGTRGNASASGRLLLDAATGTIRKTELWVDSKTENVRINVTYAPDAKLGLWLPEKMSETYDWRELDDVASNRGVGAYGERQFFQANAIYSNARHSPIDLSRMRR